MKRDGALVPLSRDHNRSLILAQLLRKNAPVYRDLPAEPWNKAKYAQGQFEANIKTHFSKEEKMLNKVKDCHAAVGVVADDIKSEHQKPVALFSSLTNTDDLANTMDLPAVTLPDYIRKEERELFPLLQQHCSLAQIQEIYELLH